MTQHTYLHETEMNGRPDVLQYVDNIKAKQKDNFKLLDIGASWNCFDSRYLTHTFDLHPPNIPGVHHFPGDINDYECWQPIFEYVEEHGKFDFCNCTHTLEDIAYPQGALKYMPRIAKRGFIAVPSKYWELQRRERFRGGVHHRWIIINDGNDIVLYPKMNLIDYMDPYEKLEEIFNKYSSLELRVFWEDTIDFSTINNDYLGPTHEAVISMYHEMVRPELNGKLPW